MQRLALLAQVISQEAPTFLKDQMPRVSNLLQRGEMLLQHLVAESREAFLSRNLFLFSQVAETVRAMSTTLDFTRTNRHLNQSSQQC